MAAMERESRLAFSSQAIQPPPRTVPWKTDLTTAFPVDGVGDLKPPSLPTLLITTDNVPDTPDTAGNTNPVITVTSPGVTTPIVSTIDTIGDQDFYRVTLTAGVTYELGLYSFVGGPNAVGLTDPYLELYAADGTTLVVSADGGADTVYNQINSGFDTLLTYTPATSGTYFVNARAFSNTPLTPTGDSVGDYELFVREQDPNDPNIYRPYYEPTEPLYAIDWGTQVNKVNQSARNPDGNEGTRATGNAQGVPVFGGALDIPALAAAQGADVTGKNVITIYFARAGDIFVSNDPTNPGLPPATITATDIQDFERAAVWTSLEQFERVADVVYLEVDDRDLADFVYTSYIGTPGPGVSLLGSMSPPDESDEGLAQFNSGDERWNALNLQQGGFSFVTLIHEFGHGHGLAHPHDNGGHSGIMNGVASDGVVADYTTGDFELNQGVFTMMSYEDGWQSSPYGNAPTDVGYGYLGGLMAFDIAAIQDKYGVNEDWATGNDTYALKDVNAAGTFFSSIWDGGGIDAIAYAGTRDATIDLRAATLAYEPGGGGNISFATGIFGGFTIANGVTIENATGGDGDDTLLGNAAANTLDGGAGDDLLDLSAGGDDDALGGSGTDILYFGTAFGSLDRVDGGAGTDVLVLQGDYALTLGALHLVGTEFLSLQSGSVTRFGQSGTARYDYVITSADANAVAGQQLVINAQSLLAGEDLTFDGSAETDGGRFLVYAGHGTDDLTGGQGNDIFHFEGARFGNADRVAGGGGSDAIVLSMGNGTHHIEFSESQFSGIEAISVNNRFASDPSAMPSYELVLKNGNVTAGGSLIVNSSSLAASQSSAVDGSLVIDGSLDLYGGAGDDTLAGGAQGDLLYGGNGADVLTGGGGDDVFRFDALADSAPGAADQLLDFALGDLIDLSRIDADPDIDGDQDFAFIGNAAFTGSGGQLRFEDAGGGSWLVQADIDGDSASDFEILVTLAGVDPITASDFLL